MDFSNTETYLVINRERFRLVFLFKFTCTCISLFSKNLVVKKLLKGFNKTDWII